MLPTFATQTVTRLRPTAKTIRGSEILDWSDPDRKEIQNCSMQPATTSLSQDGRVLGISESYTCYMPAGSDIEAGDRIEYNGNVYTITGEPQTWPSATGALDHIQLNLQRWQG
jgi:hypothetical protein